MKSFIFILLVCSLNPSAYGQVNKQTNIAKNFNGDTTYFFKWNQEKANELMLQNLILSTDQYHFRFWTNRQTIDIWTNDNKTINGLLTNYIGTYKKESKYKDARKSITTISNQIQLDTSLARQTYNIVQTISSLPSKDSINGWGFGADGITYCLEIATPKYYSFKTYWSPKSFASRLVEAKLIQEFVDKIYLTLELQAEYDKFINTLNPGNYSIENLTFTKFTKKGEKKFKDDEPNRDYLESIKDTLNKFLSDTLTKLIMKSGGLDCFNDFFLIFSPKNKLIKIMTNRKFYGIEDRLEYNKCKKKIRKAFKQIKVDFVKCNRKYMKELDYYDNKVYILQ